MKPSKYLISLVMPFACILALSFSGCSTARGNTPRPGQMGAQQNTNQLTTTPFTGRTIPNKVSITPVSPNAAQTGTNTGTGTQSKHLPQAGMQVDRQRADKVRNQLGNIRKLRRLNVVVNGNTALVGFTPVETVTDINSLRKEVNDTVKKTDKNISKVVTTTSVDVISNINQLALDIGSNAPVAEVTNRFKQIVQTVKAGAK